MARPDPKISCPRVRVQLEAYLDDDLPSRRAARLRAHLESCFACNAELEDARRVRDTLRALPMQHLPMAALETVLQRARAAEAAVESAAVEREARTALRVPGGLGDRLRRWAARRGPLVWRPALAAVSAVGIVVALLVVTRPRPQRVTPEELAHAELQIQWVMAHLGDIGRRTGITVQQEVIEARVVKPTTQAVENAFERQPRQ
jgi:anti-sigma factor RsiW